MTGVVVLALIIPLIHIDGSVRRTGLKVLTSTSVYVSSIMDGKQKEDYKDNNSYQETRSCYPLRHPFIKS